MPIRLARSRVDQWLAASGFSCFTMRQTSVSTSSLTGAMPGFFDDTPDEEAFHYDDRQAAGGGY